MDSLISAARHVVFETLSPTQLGLVLSVLVVLTARSVARRRQWKLRNPRGLPPPPGIKGVPILGNLLQIPRIRSWEVYPEWAKEYGNLFALNVFGRSIAIVNSYEEIVNLLDKNTVYTASRAFLPTTQILEASSVNFAAMVYGHKWREHRRAFHQTLHQGQVPLYHPIIEEEMTTALKELVDGTPNAGDWTRRLVGYIMMRIAYGVKDLRYNTELIEEAERFIDRISDATVSGRYFVNMFPWMRFIPSWFPGAAWKRKLEDGRQAGLSILERPYSDAKARAAAGKLSTEYHSMVNQLIAALPEPTSPDFEHQEEVARGASAAAYSAGGDTTIISIETILIAFAMYPDVLRKAQEEVDRVTDNLSRMPNFSDIDNMPYLNAIVKEGRRWHTALPLALSHVVTEDYEYNGYFLPKGVVILANVWSITNDPKIYPNPREFQPERFLKTSQNADGSLRYEENLDVLDSGVVFGFGRRVCPGRHLSKDTVSFVIMNLIALFDVVPRKGTEGTLQLEPTTALISKPTTDLKVEFVPRSSQHLGMIPQ